MLFIAFSVLVYTFYRIFDCSFNKTRNTDFCSNFNFCRCYLSILIMFLDFSSLLYLVVYAFIWRIIIQAIKRILAGVKSMIANFYAFFLVFLSLFVLKATTSHIFIKSFVCFNTLYHINDLSFLYFFASLSQYGREQCPGSAKPKNPLLLALFQRLHDIHRASGCVMLLLVPTLDIYTPSTFNCLSSETLKRINCASISGTLNSFSDSALSTKIGTLTPYNSLRERIISSPATIL